MDVVEEFLELGKDVICLRIMYGSFHQADMSGYVVSEQLRSVCLPLWQCFKLSIDGSLAHCSRATQQLIKRCGTLMIMDVMLRKNLCDLADRIEASNDKHVSRTFWRWLSRQSWRQMLPEPWELLI